MLWLANSIWSNVICIENFQFACNVVRLVAEQFQVLLIGFEYGEFAFDFLQFIGHIGCGSVYNTAQTSKCARKFSAKIKANKRI